MRAIVGSNFNHLLNSKSPLIWIVGKQQKIHKPRSLNYCFIANQRVLFFAMHFLPYKDFELMGHLKTAKCECFWSSAEHTAEAVTCQRKIYLSHSKNPQISTSLCSKSVKTFLIMHLCTLPQHAFTNALHERVIWNLPGTNVCETASKTQLKQLLARCTNWTTKKYYYAHCTTKKHAKF